MDLAISSQASNRRRFNDHPLWGVGEKYSEVRGLQKKENIMFKTLTYRMIESTIYEINEYGTIRNKKTGKTLKWQYDRDGYACVMLKNNIHKRARIHRLVLENFDTYSDLTVNHKDGNKLNNHISNLEYLTIEENLEHRYVNGMGRIKRYPVYQYDEEYRLIHIYKSAEEAAKLNHTYSRNIKRACLGPYHRHKGYLYYRSPIVKDMV